MILNEIVESTRQRVQSQKMKVPFEEIVKLAIPVPTKNKFYNAIGKKGISYICEVKKASPSKGIICENFDFINIAKEYEEIGANAISVLTEPNYFLGDLKYLKQIKQEVSIPLLQKEFIIDEYQIHEARAYGADAILLICSILETEQLSHYILTAKKLNMDVLVETRDEKEIDMAIKSGAKIIGINNRNLKNMSVDISTTIKLRDYVGEGVLLVSESGIKCRADIANLEKIRVDAVLIGETLMKAVDKRETLKYLKGNGND